MEVLDFFLRQRVETDKTKKKKGSERKRGMCSYDVSCYAVRVAKRKHLKESERKQEKTNRPLRILTKLETEKQKRNIAIPHRLGVHITNTA